jgi:uncharacterized glyoxalase superfamily protein PhnB
MTAFPVLRARDPRALIAWAETALDAALLELHEDDGEVAHAELRVADGIVMLGHTGGAMPQDPGGSTVYVVVEEPEDLWRRAVDADAEVVRELSDTDYGSRDFVVRDPEGNLWSFGTYAPEA